jgi:methionyl-tRNA formyltransferase
MKAKIVFMGSPGFALPSLRALNEHHVVVGVVTQPDRPAGRRRAMKPPPVKVLARELGLSIIQPASLREPAVVDHIKYWEPEVIVVAAFGQILRSDALDLPPFGCLNVHASLLPRWRGAAPIQAAILNGDNQTGVTIMQMDTGLDTGPILSQRTAPISINDTAGSLGTRLENLGAELLAETLEPYIMGQIIPRHQDDTLATYAPLLKKADGKLDLRHSADELERRIRAFSPWPGTTILWQNKILKIHQAHVVNAGGAIEPGQTTIHDGLPAVGTGLGLLVLDQVQPAGRKTMPADVFLRGARNWGDEPVGDQNP